MRVHERDSTKTTIGTPPSLDLRRTGEEIGTSVHERNRRSNRQGSRGTPAAIGLSGVIASSGPGAPRSTGTAETAVTATGLSSLTDNRPTLRWADAQSLKQPEITDILIPSSGVVFFLHYRGMRAELGGEVGLLPVVPQGLCFVS